MKFPTSFTYQNIHGFEQFPCNNLALVFVCFLLIPEVICQCHINSVKLVCLTN